MAKSVPRSTVGLSWIVTWPLLVVFAAVVFFCAERLRVEIEDGGAAVNGADWQERLPERIEALTGALETSSLRVSSPVETRTGSGSVRYTHRLYTAQLRPEDQIEVQLALEGLRALDSGIAIAREPRAEGFDVKIGLDGLLTHTVVFRPVEQKRPPPRLAFVARGLGDDLRVARQFASAELPIALGVRPFRPFSAQVAELGHLFQREVVLDLSVSLRPAGEAARSSHLTLGEDLSPQLDVALASVPHAVAVVADLDADLRSDPRQLEPFLAELRERDLLYVGGEIVPEGLAAVMKSIGGPAEIHTWAVHASTEAALTDKQLNGFVDERTGSGVVLVDPGVDILQSLIAAIPAWRAAGAEIVPLSVLADGRRAD